MKSKNSFSSKLRQAQDGASIIKGFKNYTPPRIEESVEGFQAFINIVAQTNQSETNLMKEYRLLVDERQLAFFRESDSVERLFPALKAVIAAQYGKKSVETRVLKTISNRMRYTKVTKIVKDETGTDQERSYGVSEKTFGSMAKNFNDFVTTISGFDSYKPEDELFKLEKLNEILTNVNRLNDAIAEKKSQLQTIKNDRESVYYELSDRWQRIKSYVRGKYGSDSNEYNQIRSINL